MRLSVKALPPFLLALAASTLYAQNPPHMRTRSFTALTNVEVEQYLKRNDIIFVPVGTSESFGMMPNDLEYVMAEAYAQKMAEEVDGLVLQHVIYFYPGVTATGVGSVYVPEDLGQSYLKAIAHSLLRQGFRRQIYLSAHGPSDQFVSGMVRQFFEETKVPILYMHMGNINRVAAEARGITPPAGGGRGAISYGSYYVVGRINDLPLDLDPPVPTQPQLPRPPASVSILGQFAPESSAVGSYEPDPEHSGGRALQPRHITAQQREQMGKDGAAMIEANVKALDMPKVVQALRDEDKYVHDTILPRFKDILPQDQF